MSLDELRRQCREIEFKPKCGVYLLMDEDEVVYAGSSRDIEGRISQHRSDPIKKFNRIWWLPIPPGHFDHYEGALARAFRPKYNGRVPADRGCDVEILQGLGLDHLIEGLRPFGLVRLDYIRTLQ